MSIFIRAILAVFFALVPALQADTISGNQTDALSPIYSSDSLPFTIDVELASFTVPGGLQTYAFGVYDNQCLCIAGRTNGLHGFEAGDDNFPPRQQNTNVYVIDLDSKKVYIKSLADKTSGLSQSEIDSLSVTAPEYLQSNKTLYVVGGYGVDTATGQFSTKSILSAIDIPGLIHWVKKSSKGETAKEHIRQISNPIFQVTGGSLHQISAHDPLLLIFGQNFIGFYSDGSNGEYTQQVRSFKLLDDGNRLALFAEKYKPMDPNYRRRDLNTVPIVQLDGKNCVESFMALAGVFTLQNGIWTVPVFIDGSGDSYMPNPSKSSTFKQAMNIYDSAHVGLFSKKANEMHTVLLGGISYEVYSNGEFSFDSEIPFSNNITDVVIDKNGYITQHLFDNEYPVIVSELINPGNPLLFGAGARFIAATNLSAFSNGVFSLDSLKKRTLLGYVIGGIMSTLPNTNTQADSAASPYIFKVYATPR